MRLLQTRTNRYREREPQKVHRPGWLQTDTIRLGAERHQIRNAKDLRVEKNQLMFTVTAEFNGSSMQVDYQGRPYGDKIAGTLKYDIAGNTGDGEFVAKRKPEKE